MMTSVGKKELQHMLAAFLPDTAFRLVLLFIWILLFSLVTKTVPVQAADTNEQEMVNCNIHSAPCRQDLSGMAVVLDINPKPVKAMTNLNFRVTFAEKQAVAAPYIDLGMPGMKMGPNRVSLKSVGKGVYEGTGIIVRCPSGKRIWKATVTLPNVGSVDFVFDVIY